jgi:hypothetical protein
MLANDIRIVTVDGEGKTVHNRHGLTLMAWADDRGGKDHIDHDGTRREGYWPNGMADDAAIPPNYGLTSKRCFEFLLGIPKDPSDLVISFAFGYDTTKLLQDLPRRNLIEFAKFGITEWAGYIISGIPRKHLTIRHDDRECVIWDVFSYWQMSFIKVLDSSKKELFNTPEWDATIEFMRIMKATRGDEDAWAKMSPEETLNYCYKECEALSILYRDILRHCEHYGLNPNRHSGPGAMAEAFFRSVRLIDYMPDDTGHYQAGLPTQVATHSIYGGRFETAILGPVGDVIEDDLQSAYPAEALNLPCLRHGRFREVPDYVPGKQGFYFVGSLTDGPWAPFPFRVSKETRYLFNGATPGTIVYPHGGRRWVTAAEVEIARNHYGAKKIPVFKGYVFEPDCNHKPFAKIQELYNYRKIGNPSCPNCLGSKELFCKEHPSPSEGLKKFIKLILNSIYGKLLQGIGWKLIETSQYGVLSSESYKAPVFQCYIWASWITGGCRSKVMGAALKGGKDVVSIATDGILTRKPIDGLHVTTWELGTWEESNKKDCWLGMPGIYAFGSNPSEKEFKRRGLDSRYFPAWHLRRTFERGEWSVKPVGDWEHCKTCIAQGYACSKHPMIAFMPLRWALMRTNGLDLMGEWIPMEKSVKFLSVQHKRNLAGTVDPFMPHDGSPIELVPFTIPDDAMSAPFKPKQEWWHVRDNIQIETMGKIDDYDVPTWYEDIGTDWEE